MECLECNLYPWFFQNLSRWKCGDIQCDGGKIELPWYESVSIHCHCLNLPRCISCHKWQFASGLILTAKFSEGWNPRPLTLSLQSKSPRWIRVASGIMISWTNVIEKLPLGWIVLRHESIFYQWWEGAKFDMHTNVPHSQNSKLQSSFEDSTYDYTLLIPIARDRWKRPQCLLQCNWGTERCRSDMIFCQGWLKVSSRMWKGGLMTGVAFRCRNGYGEQDLLNRTNFLERKRDLALL